MDSRHAGLLPTLIALLIVAATLTIVGVIVWMRMATNTVPAKPPQPAGAVYRAPARTTRA
jgi:flagellar basal body-associated protein FliL